MRIQGAFVNDKELMLWLRFLKIKAWTPQYTEEVTTMAKKGSVQCSGS